ncbi:DeoR family transcriptional regulator, partial [Yersinia pestis]|nr:DeoR family transcriptional regulator [Yersinia pestis]
KRVLLADASKYGKVATYLALPLTAFDVVITDNSLSSTVYEELAEKALELIIASPPR